MSTVKPHNPCQPMSPLSTTPKSFLKKVLKDNTLRFIPVHRLHQFRHLKSSSHQNLPPTTQGLKPHIYRAFYNAYCTMHVLDKQLNLETANLDPLEYGFVQDNEYLVSATSWRILETSWSTVCNCNKCARASCSCRSEMIKCCVFCKCHKTDVIDCRNPYNS